MRKIIIGYDGTEQGNDALALGRELAETFAAQPVVIASATWPVYLMGTPALEEAVHKYMDPMLEIARERLRGLEPVTRAVHTQSVAGELVAAAEAEDADLIVVGSSHHGPVGRVVMGSVGTALIQGAPCAVAVAPLEYSARDGSPLSKIGVAFNGSPEAWSAFDAAVGIAERADASLTVITVADFPTYGYAAAWAVYTAGELADAEEKEKKQVLELALSRTPDGLSVEGRLLTGSAGEMLSEASGDFDLMLVGSRSYGPIGRTLLGGVATHLIHSAACAVLVLPRGAGDDPFNLGSSLVRQAEELA
jgi:nucleotide-binding universal stress UspA family protein